MSRLKDNLNPQSLNLSRTGASIARACSMTDEPDGSCAEMAWLVQDTTGHLSGALHLAQR